jgi:hypothetical protein
MFYPALEEQMSHAKRDLETATGENVIELCQRYMTLLDEYRSELYLLAGTPEVRFQPGSSSLEEVERTRKALRSAIERNTLERNRTAALLLSFTSVSGYEAVGIINRLRYKGHDDWELRAGGVTRFSNGTALDRMTVQEAVDTASLLLRGEHTARNANIE